MIFILLIHIVFKEVVDVCPLTQTELFCNKLVSCFNIALCAIIGAFVWRDGKDHFKYEVLMACIKLVSI